MATASKSSGRKQRRKSTTASKRATARRPAAKSVSKSKAAARRSGAKATKAAPRKKSSTKRSARKQSPVTRIKRVATGVFQQGATAAKQGVQAVERLVEEVKDRVTS